MTCDICFQDPCLLRYRLVNAKNKLDYSEQSLMNVKTIINAKNKDIGEWNKHMNARSKQINQCYNKQEC